MKLLRIKFLLIFSLWFTVSGNAQNGTSAPDFTVTDLDGVEWNLYDILDSGKHVLLDFSAVWCTPCWNFHQEGVFQTLNDLYGPNGTDQIRVFFIEADDYTNTDCLYGLPTCNTGNFGDWVADHDYPFIDLTSTNGSTMSDDFGVIGFPTVIGVSANGNNGMYELITTPIIEFWESWLFESFEMEVTADITHASCTGYGSIDLTTTNGASFIYYNWDTGSSSSSINFLDPGEYTVTVSDINGYQLVETYVIEGSVQIELVSSTDVMCYGENSGSISIEGVGGSGNVYYDWSNGDYGPEIADLSGGDYTVTVTDNDGCTETETFTIFEPNQMEMSTYTEESSCEQENGIVEVTCTGGVAPFQYDYGNGSNSSGLFYDLAPGDYVMSVTDANACVESIYFTIDVVEGPTVQTSVDGELDCSTLEVVVSGLGSTQGNNIEYAWSSNDGNIVEGENAIDAVVDAPGLYTLTVTNTIEGCSESQFVIVNANTESPVSVIDDPDMLTCVTSSTLLDGSQSSGGNNFTYLWLTDDGNIVSGANTNIAEVNAPGEYRLVITNSTNGCNSESTVAVELDDEQPAIVVEDAMLTCVEPEVNICADVDANTTVTWMTESGEIEATCITVSNAGTYMAVAKGSNGCESTAEAVVTLSADLPQIDIIDPMAITCSVSSVAIDAELEGNIEDYTISWTNEAGEEINTSDLSVEVNEAGDYALTVTNPENGCSTVTSVTVDEVIVNPESAFDADLTDGTLQLTNVSNGDPSSFSWSFGSEDENPSTTFDETGTYEICLTVTNDCGQDTYCEDVYFVSQLLFESSLTDVACYGVAEGSISVTPSGGEPDYYISWTGPNGFTSTSLEISDLSVGDYYMVLTDNYGYEKSKSFTIEQPTEIIENSVEIIDETNTAANGSISIDVSGGTGVLTYAWTNGATTASVDGLSSGDYSVVVTDENGCTITFGPYPVVNSTVGVEDLDFVASLEIYPVPAVNYLSVNVELVNVEATQLKVINPFGKVISTDNYYTKDISAKIDVNDLPSGIYYIEFGNTSQKTLEKFVVIR